MLTRRRFLTGAAGLLGAIGIGGLIPLYRQLGKAQPVNGKNRILVVVELYGGNDGLNTVIPYQQSLYYQKRPTLAVAGHLALPLNAQLALHPSLKPLQPWFEKKQLAVVEGVGYPNPNLSHFRSMDIWWSGDPGPERQTGWLGRYLDATAAPGQSALRAVNIGSTMPKSLVSRKTPVASVESLQGTAFTVPPFEGSQSAWMAAYQALNRSVSGDPFNLADAKTAGRTAISVAHTLSSIPAGNRPAYPAGSLSAQLALVADMIRAGIPTEIYTVSLGGFDDHASESNQESRTLAEYAQAMDAFFRDLTAQGKAQQVVALTYSEFGRRVMENASGGTDHGTASCVFLMGGAVKGGIYGETPSLTNLDPTGNLKYTVDFRQIYSVLLERWLDADPVPSVGKRWPVIDFV